MLALTEVIGLLGKQALPVLPPWGTGLTASLLKRAGFRLPPEMVLQLRYGRGLDNRRFRAAGFAYDHSTRDTVLMFGEHLRLGSVLEGRPGALPLREGGRGLPAVEPQRAGSRSRERRPDGAWRKLTAGADG